MKYKIIFLITTFCFFNSLWSQQPTQQWLNRYNGLGDYSDKYNCSAKDNNTNIFLAGYTVKNGSKKDYLLVKINALGDTLWTKTFNGLGSKDDEILSIVADGVGNVFVTGYSRDSNNGDDIVTIKYDSNGALIWMSSYNNGSNNNDQGNSIALDNSGNIYVTGQTNVSTSSVSNDDYVTIKYNSSGTQQWVKFYNGLGNSTDRSISISCDSNGNSIISGRSNNGSDDDFVTIKYDANGTVLWNKTLDSGMDDRPIQLKLDNVDNVYVTGRTNNGTDDDYLTMKYNSNGVEQWIGGVVYQGVGGNDKASALTIDGSGNVYVTGKTDNDPSATTNYDYCTIKYNNFGIQQWVKTFNGVGDLTDEASSILFDANSNNIIVTGRSDGNNNPLIDNFDIYTIAYNTAGTLVWSQTFQGTSNLNENSLAIIQDASNSIYILGFSEIQNQQKNALVLKYSNSGTLSWAKYYNGQGDNTDNVNAIYVDPTGSYTYLAGYTYNASTEKDMLVVKINALGDTLWTRTYNGSDNNSDEATGIKVDQTGNIYVTGYSKENATDYDITTIKYNSSGVQMWVAQYNNTLVNGEDKGVDLFVDNTGNVIVSGYSDGDASMLLNEDYVTLKYNSSGVQQWATRFNGNGNGTDIPIGISAQQTGKVFVSGKSDNGSNDDFVTICYNASGVQQWQQIYDGTIGNDRPIDLFLDNSGNVTVTGRKDNGNDDDIVTIQYASSGIQNWINTYNSTLGDDRGVSVANDNLGNTVVTGTVNNGTQLDIVVFEINTSGVQTWSNVINGVGNLDDIPSEVLFDGNGFIIVVGQTDLTATNSDFFIRKYNALGQEIWSKTYDGQILQNDGINALGIDASYNVYVTGNSISNAGQKDIVTIKYNSPLSLGEIKETEKNVFIFPNPMKNNVTIQFENKNKSEVVLDIVSISGENAATFISNDSSFNLENINLNSGIYIIKLKKEDDSVFFGKLIVQ
ncbi:MAG: SBBP repeat-containing protein [Flavobacteriia bacterium]|nr:SBBP repeat-containing protein [Flavobacteriia bacterium]